MSQTNSGQIQFFSKNKLDLEALSANINITDSGAIDTGQAYVSYLRDRKNYTAWLTTGSADANNTEILCTFGDLKDIDSIILVGHNLKSFTVEYWTGLVWALVTLASDNSTVSETNNTETTNFYFINKVNTDRIRITITGTQVADSDKRIQQLILTERIGQLSGWPVIRRPEVETNKRRNKMLSGKTRIRESLEAFSCTLDVRNWNIQSDIDIIEEVYFRREGVLFWINSNKPEQFSLDLKGYRKEDIFLVRPTNSWRPELSSGLYKTGIRASIPLSEVIT